MPAGPATAPAAVPLGFGRVYVRLDGDLDAAAWLRGLDAGRSFVTTGPMLFVTLDGRDPGHRFEPAEPGPQPYRLGGSAVAARPLGRIEVVVNGEVARTLEPANRRTDRGSYESPIDATLTSESLSDCFERPLVLELRGGRWTARLDEGA